MSTTVDIARTWLFGAKAPVRSHEISMLFDSVFKNVFLLILAVCARVKLDVLLSVFTHFQLKAFCFLAVRLSVRPCVIYTKSL